MRQDSRAFGPRQGRDIGHPPRGGRQGRGPTMQGGLTVKDIKGGRVLHESGRVKKQRLAMPGNIGRRTAQEPDARRQICPLSLPNF